MAGEDSPRSAGHPGQGAFVSRRPPRRFKPVHVLPTPNRFTTEIPVVPKQLMFDDNARAKLLKGVEKLAGAVAVRRSGPTRPQRDHRQVIRRPDGHQGRRDR